MRCPSCKQNNTHTVENIYTSDLIELYNKNTGIDISHLLYDRVITYQHCNECDLFFFSPALAGDDKFYESLQRLSWYYLKDKNEYHYAKTFISTDDTVLEIGCGNGFFADLISTRNYSGLEFNDAAIIHANNRGLHVSNQSIEAHSEQFHETYDVVCSFQVLEHVVNIHSFISSALKCLKSGGFFILAVPNHDSFIRYCLNGYLNLPPHHLSHWTVKALSNISKIHNIRLIDIYQEKMEEIHEKWFFQTFFYKILADKFNRPFKLIDRSLQALFFIKLSSFLAKLIKQPLPREILPVGHTICVVYKKQ